MTRGRPSETCGDHGGRRNNGEPCGRAAGWGTDFDTGKCRNCRGTKPDGTVPDDHGAPEGNTNAVSHGAYTEQKKLYSEEFSDRERDLADWIFQDHLDRYIDRHDAEPPAEYKLRLFNCAVNAVTEMRVENWYTDQPDELNTGTPLIDKETHVTETGERYYRYKKSPSAAAVQHLTKYNERWLSKLDLLPETDATATGETVEGVITIISSEANSGGE